MKTIAVFVALVAVALAAPQGAPEQVVVVKEDPSNNIGVDGYDFSYELSDGQAREEIAKVEPLPAREDGEPRALLRVAGSYSFVAPDGQTYTVGYVADENGFQPQGAHLPVAPAA